MADKSKEEKDTKDKDNKDKDKEEEEDLDLEDSDDDKEDGKDEKGGEKTSRLDKMKKGFASRFMNSKAGRTAVTSFIGTEGNEILECLKSFVTKDKSKQDGKEFKKDVLKIAAKVKIMVDSKKLTPENTKDAQQPTLKFAELFNDYIEPGSTKTAEEVLKLKSELKESMGKCYKILFTLVKPHMKEKNSAKITSLYTYFCSDDFFHKIRRETKFQDERRTLHQNLEAILSTVQASFSPDMPCQIAGCDKKRTPAQGTFPGSELCPIHHYKKFVPQLESPSFAYWLKEESLRTVMMAWLQKEDQLEVVSFSQAVEQYKSITRAPMRSSRAPLIYKKFIEAKSVPIDEKTATSIKTEMETSGEQVSKQLFDRAQLEMIGKMQKLFETKFLETKEYKDWVQRVTLPPDIYTEAHEQYLKLKEADLNLKKISQGQVEKEAARLHEQYDKEKKGSSASTSTSSTSSSSSSSSSSTAHAAATGATTAAATSH